MRRLLVASILLTFLLVPLMVISLNPATAASRSGGPPKGGGGGGGQGGGGGSGHGGPGNGVHDCGGDPDCGGQVTVQVVETVEVISRVTLTIPVVYIIPSGPGTPGTVTVDIIPPQTGPLYDLIETSILLFLIAAVGAVITIGRNCATGQHFPHLTLPTKAVKTTTDIPITKTVDSADKPIAK